MCVTIVCNRTPRFIIEGFELSASERKEFEYLDWKKIDAGEDSASFFRYRGELYDIGEFSCIPDHVPGAFLPDAWKGYFHGYQSDSFFSGILIRYCADHESIVVGRYYS